MGNTTTLQQEAEDQDRTTDDSQAASELPGNVQNGPVTLQVVQAVSSTKNDEVDARASIIEDNAAVSSQKTMEISSVSDVNGKNLGNGAKKPMPAAKSRFVLAFSRPVPGRTEERATDSSVGSATLDVSSEMPEVNKASSETVELPATAAPEEGLHKNLNQAPSAASISETELAASASLEGENAVPSKPKQVTFFDRLFKLEKGKEKSKTQIETQEGSQATDIPDGGITAEEAAGLQSTPSDVPQGKDLDDCNQKGVQQDVAGASCPVSEDPDKTEVKQESSKSVAATELNNSMMSFLKTLVSPSKAEAKSESEDKSAKEAQQTTNTKGAEQQSAASTNVKSEKNAPVSQEPQTTKQNTKAPEPAAQQQAAAAAATETPKDTTKEKAASTPTPLSKLFWKKTAPEDAEVVSNQKVEASLEAVAPDKDVNKSTEATEVTPRREETKPPKTNLRKFFKLSVKDDAGTANSEEVKGPNPNYQTSDSTERPVAPAESEPVGQKSKESSKDKKSTAELSKQKGNKQETKDQQDSREQHTGETDSIQNGGDTAKETPLKKTEKRQSLGGFFKGLGPKKMSDAEVQTDPVSIVPAGKSK
ncbi:PREDICTED: breast carcinoma-amplified sequence 1 isoform X3 [Crocodylus porosus]|uniref:breast carcinoma-amplified sequence 1 isoform X3 n=1 Tax=Crocodylus porosus TaxID=8502 RepID=UPI0009394410|nr:PREDICTED: breast carcinoma-amplified sequence 1 isoform X3 [Crocodylus porosus]